MAASLPGAFRKSREDRGYGDSAMRKQKKGDNGLNSEPLHGQSPLFHAPRDDVAQGRWP